MAENPSSGDDAKKQARSVAREVSGAAQDLYDQRVESTTQVADATKAAARKTADSFDTAQRRTWSNGPTQPRW